MLEGKIDYAIQRHQGTQAGQFLKIFKLYGLLPKYVPWVEKQIEFFAFKNHPESPHEAGSLDILVRDMMNIINGFEKMLSLNRIPPDKKDINQYKNVYVLRDTVEEAEAIHKEKSIEKEAKTQATKGYFFKK